ncbi:MAG: hypothetical protein H6531_05565 [Actinobacteria bacterium]|nr:hypothetical protein [Thermoleophilia bacterium]MCB9011281.1 hypothetical protein [Actinomycetota bacterium]
MNGSGHRRRGSDGRPRPSLIAPTPAGPLGVPDPDGVCRSIDLALSEARRGRRHLTLVAIDVHGADLDLDLTLHRVADAIRNMVRHTDGIWRDSPSSLALLLADVDGPTVEPVLARIRLRLKDAFPGVTSMGRAAAPPGVKAADLLSLARGDRDV